MTSGSTPATGLTAQMIYYDPAKPPAAADIKGPVRITKKRALCAAVPKINRLYAAGNSILSSYAWEDVSWETPGAAWPERWIPVPMSQTSSFYSRYNFSQLNAFASTAIAGGAAGMVQVYDLSPGAAFGLIQRSVYTPTGQAGAGAVYSNVPTLCLDRVNGAKVITDAKAGKMATLTLLGHFQVDHGKAWIGYLPGKDYGTPSDKQIMIATHTDAMSLVEENGGLGLLGVMYYFNHIPQAQRPRTLIFYFDSRHFMPGGEGSWPQYDYYNINPQLLPRVMATVGMEHMGGRATYETGADGNDYEYTQGGPNSGAYILPFIDINGNNRYLYQNLCQSHDRQPTYNLFGSKAGPIGTGNSWRTSRFDPKPAE